jgi:glycosyltransferase involved in cell wall biosynthesis
MDKISVIIPCFNARNTLLRAIISVQNQTFSSVELIVIDGKSTDGSVEVINTLEKKPDYFISEKDRGVYDAINKGLEKATGNWIYILGADDYLLNKNVLSELMSLVAPNTDLLFGYIENESPEIALFRFSIKVILEKISVGKTHCINSPFSIEKICSIRFDLILRIRFWQTTIFICTFCNKIKRVNLYLRSLPNVAQKDFLNVLLHFTVSGGIDS